MLQVNAEWKRVYQEIITNGLWQNPEDVRAKWADGTPAPAKFITGASMEFDNSEALINTDKFVPEKSPLRELAWIWIEKSNVVARLQEMGCSVWDEWEIKEGPWKGTIGPAYGYQLGIRCRNFPISKIRWEHLNPKDVDRLKRDAEMSTTPFIKLDQVDFLIQSLLTNSGSRRLGTTLVNIEHLDQMALEPCVWKTGWQKFGNKMNVIIGVRSNDMCLGNSFNVFQYQALQKMICQVTGLEVGTIKFDIDNPHVYGRHLDEAQKWFKYEGSKEIPIMKLNPFVKNFYEFDVDKDIVIENYNPGPKRHFEVAE